ncbi:hypothetical protein I317_03408 [Kwoniella heveanensis CBS 569]|nr:hypothetical protein I317_03408 [Kwoniella heveanensis CBS 569]
MSNQNSHSHPTLEISKEFPSSTAEPSKLFRFPGVSWDSTKAVREVLEENDRGYDIYEKARFAHNHFPHSALTRYALGGSPKLLRDTWDHDRPHLVSLDPADKGRKDIDVKDVPEKIDASNWGDRRYIGVKGNYSRYLVFFHKELAKLGPLETLNRYVFSPQANWEPFKCDDEKEREGPMMLDRLVGGVLHPFIHAGFGLEFNDRVTLAEGLAEAAIHSDELNAPVLTPEYIKEVLHPSNPPSCAREPRLGRSLLEIYSIMLSSNKLTPAPYDKDSLINDKLKLATQDGKAEALRKLVDEWSLTDEELADGKDGWERKFEEVAILVTLLACATGREGRPPRVDFFLMHTLTSSIFIPTYLPLLSTPNRRVLLRAYTLVALHTALARGKPRINSTLLMSYDAFPTAPGSESLVKPKKGKIIGDPEKKESRNGWLDVVESSLAYTDSHVPKAIRSLLHFSNHYGAYPPGSFIGTYLAGGQTHETIPGLAQVDGSVFIRAAGMIMQQLGWTREGQEEGNWDFEGIGYDEVWEK